jgi:predicted ABC-type ATPase
MPTRSLAAFRPLNHQPARSGRLLLGEVRESIDRRETFALESTLSGKTYVRIFRRALSSGYEMELHYLWLSSVDQAIARVRRMGGHDVPVADIRRRFKRSLIHLVDDYLPLAERWVIWDNRGLPAKRMATSGADDVNSVRPLIGL